MKRLFEKILIDAIAQRVSDIHFIPIEHAVLIKFRVNDMLLNYESIEITTYQKLLTFLKFLSGLDVSTYHQAQSGQTTFKHQMLYNLRVSTLPLSLGMESCVIRVSPQYFTQEFECEGPKHFHHLMNKKQGLILFTGPTGSGKSTMMYEMVSFAKEKLNLNIITVEDPVEKRIPGITQISVNEKLVSTMKVLSKLFYDVIQILSLSEKFVKHLLLNVLFKPH